METSREGAVNVETIVKGSSEVITVNILNGFFPRDGYSPYLSEGFLCSLRLIPTFCILWHDLNTLYGTQRLFSSVLRLGNRFKVEVCSKIADLGFSTLWRVLEILWRDFARIWLELRSSASFLMDSVCLVMRCYQETHGSCRREAVDFCKTRGPCLKVLHWNVVVFTWSACRRLEVSVRYSCEMASSAKASAGEDGAASRRINFVLTLDLFTDFCSIHPAFRESSFCSWIATLILRTRCFFVVDGVFVAKPDLELLVPSRYLSWQLELLLRRVLLFFGQSFSSSKITKFCVIDRPLREFLHLAPKGFSVVGSYHEGLITGLLELVVRPKSAFRVFVMLVEWSGCMPASCNLIGCQWWW